MQVPDASGSTLAFELDPLKGEKDREGALITAPSKPDCV